MYLFLRMTYEDIFNFMVDTIGDDYELTLSEWDKIVGLNNVDYVTILDEADGIYLKVAFKNDLYKKKIIHGLGYDKETAYNFVNDYCLTNYGFVADYNSYMNNISLADKVISIDYVESSNVLYIYIKCINEYNLNSVSEKKYTIVLP